MRRFQPPPIVSALAFLTILITSAAGLLRAQAPDAPAQFQLSPERLRARLHAIEQGLDYIPGEAIVKFRAGTEPAQQMRALSVARGPIEQSNQQWVGDALLVHASGEPDAERFAGRLAEQPEVEWAHPNYLSRLQSVPNDPFYRNQWHFDLINMPAAWDINPGGSPDVTVAVIDSGVTERNTSFNFRLWTGRAFGVFNVPYAVNPDLNAAQILPGRDFVFFTAGSPVVDMVGHGTHVAGTICRPPTTAWECRASRISPGCCRSRSATATGNCRWCSAPTVNPVTCRQATTEDAKRRRRRRPSATLPTRARK
jgi:hypothetical protein